MNRSASMAVWAAVLVSGVDEVNAQQWNGGYVSGHIGMSRIVGGADADNVLVFDKNLDGDFSDTVTTAAGANAFSPGFCVGVAATSLPAGGCSVDDQGIDLGGRVGYDWQSGGWVVGGLFELTAPDHVDSVTGFSTTPAFYTFTRELSWMSGFRARTGWGGERVLVYGTGGAAWARLDHRFSTSNTVNTFTEDDSNMAWGYQLGGGADVRFGKLTAGAEYLWTQLEDQNRYTVRAQGPAAATNPFILTNSAGTDLRRADALTLGTIRFTMGYRF